MEINWRASEEEREEERERDTRSAWGKRQAWIFNASRCRRGDGYQRVSPACDPFTAAALLAQLDMDRAPINWTGLSIQSLQSRTGLLSGSQPFTIPLSDNKLKYYLQAQQLSHYP